MLLEIGPVTKQHFLPPMAGLGIGAVCCPVVLIMEVPAFVAWACWMTLGVSAAVLMVFTCMYMQYGWRENCGTGTSMRTVYACQFCGAQFQTFNAAAVHETTCPVGQASSGGGAPYGGTAATVVGIPLGGTSLPMGTVIQQQQMGPPMGQVVQNQPNNMS